MKLDDRVLRSSPFGITMRRECMTLQKIGGFIAVYIVCKLVSCSGARRVALVPSCVSGRALVRAVRSCACFHAMHVCTSLDF